MKTVVEVLQNGTNNPLDDLFKCIYFVSKSRNFPWPLVVLLLETLNFGQKEAGLVQSTLSFWCQHLLQALMPQNDILQ
jgi:hypothetical protein